jgi:hypothetical protein
MSQYGPPPAPPTPPTPVGDPPTPVVVARYLIYVTIGISLIRLILVLVNMNDIADEFTADITDRYGDGVSTGWVQSVFVAFAVAATIAFGVFWVVVAIFLGRAAHWARIAVGVFAGLGVYGVLSQLGLDALFEAFDLPPTGVIALDVADALVITAATMLLWTPDSSRRFFEAARVKPWPPPIPPG